MPGPERIVLGCIADDYTGATDVSSALVRAGLRVAQFMGVPAPGWRSDAARHAHAWVVALKSRTAPAPQAVRDTLAAAQWLSGHGAQRLYLKVCSTFDSTPAGNIGPVLQALMRARGASRCAVTPALPAQGRTVYQGHLFVGSRLLCDSPMRDHPLTPMRNANLVQVLGGQWPGATPDTLALLAHATVRQGPQAVRAGLEGAAQAAAEAVICDALDDADLETLGVALADEALVCGSAGLAQGLAAAWRQRGLPGHAGDAPAWPAMQGLQAAVSGSCSAATQAQVRHFMAGGGSAHALDPLDLAGAGDPVQRALDWADRHLASGPALIYATAAPPQVRQAQQALGVAQAGALIEQALARVAVGLVQRGVRALVVAGGETSGACIQALGVQQLNVGPEIDPGVPWCQVVASEGTTDGLFVALKSGNFGGEDFFSRAFRMHGAPGAPRGGNR